MRPSRVSDHNSMHWRALPFLVVLFFAERPGFALDKQPPSDYRARREKLANSLDGGALVLFASAEASGPNALNGYVPDKNFFYLTGWSEPGAALVIIAPAKAKNGEPARAYKEALFLPQRNLRQERWTGAKIAPESAEAKTQSGFADVEALDRTRDFLAASLPAKTQTIYTDIPGIDEFSPSAAGIEWLRRANAFSENATFQSASQSIGDLRRFKDAGEMTLIKKATGASVAAHLAALKYLDAGVSERSIAALMSFEVAKRGCERMAYSPIVGGGANSTVLHYSDNSGTLQRGDLVVMDVAGEYSFYASDITRTAPVGGKFSPRQREIYGIVLGAQQAAVAAIRPGKSTFTRTGENSIYKVAYEYINTHGKDSHGKPLGQYFIHGLSHYIGLDVHDAGTAAALQSGMVFSIEPGIYIPEEKIGVRIEDVFTIDSRGKVINLSAGLPRTADEIEMAMKHP